MLSRLDFDTATKSNALTLAFSVSLQWRVDLFDALLRYHQHL